MSEWLAMLKATKILAGAIMIAAVALAASCSDAADDDLPVVAQPQHELAAALRPALATVAFEPDSDLITEDEQAELTEFVSLALDHNGAQITIVGDTGEGDTDRSEELALNRAKEVARFLRDFGVARSLMSVTAGDNPAAIPSAQISIDTSGRGGLRYRRWEETGELSLAEFDFNTEVPDYQADLPLAMTPIDTCEQCMMEIGGLLVPRKTGEYTFWLSADDEAVLEISPNRDDQKLRPIAEIQFGRWTRPLTFTDFPEQKSRTVKLTAGTPVRIRARAREASGGDHIVIQWTPPGESRQPIPQSALRTGFETGA